jgi:hypothetical protein
LARSFIAALAMLITPTEAALVRFPDFQLQFQSKEFKPFGSDRVDRPTSEPAGLFKSSLQFRAFVNWVQGAIAPRGFRMPCNRSWCRTRPQQP